MRSIPTCKQNCDCEFMLEFLHNMDTSFQTGYWMELRRECKRLVIYSLTIVTRVYALSISAGYVRFPIKSRANLVQWFV